MGGVGLLNQDQKYWMLFKGEGLSKSLQKKEGDMDLEKYMYLPVFGELLRK